MSLAEDFFRYILWIFTSLILQLTDYIYKIITKFFSLNINQFPFIKNIYTVIIAAVVFFMLFRIVAIFAQGMWGDSSKLNKLDGGVLLQRVFAVLIILSFIPMAMPKLSEFASESALALPKIIAMKEILPSDIIVEAGNTDFLGEVSAEGEKPSLKTVTTTTINNKARGEYVYFKDTKGIVLILFLASICGYTFLMVAIQVIIRLISMILKIFLAPYAISGLVDPDDQGAVTWFKLCFADYLAIFYQMVALWAALLFAVNLPEGWSGLEKGIAFVGAIFAIVNAPSGVAQILGADIGSQSAMQSLQNVQMMTGAIGAGLGLAKTGVAAAAAGAAFAGGKAKTAGAFGIYSAGRMMGARSLNPINVSGGSSGSSGSGGGVTGDNPGYTNEQPGTYNAGENNTGSDWNNNSVTGGGSSTMTPFVNERGFVRYEDNRVTNDFTRIGRIGQSGKVGRMAGAFASHMYKKAADRVFMSNQQRNQINNAKSFGAKVSDVKQGFKTIGEALKNAPNRRN